MKELATNTNNNYCVLYCRVSTKGQEDKGLSLDGQEKLLKNWAPELGFSPVDIIKVHESAIKPERREFRKMLAFCTANGIKNILIEKRDRLNRDDPAIEALISKYAKEYDMKFHLFRENRPIHKDMSAREMFLDKIMGATDGFYVRDKVEEIEKAIKEKLNKGEYPGMPPMGYISIKKTKAGRPHTIVQTEEALKMKKLLETFSIGKFTIRQTIRLARDIGLKPRNKDTFTKGALAKMLKNKFYYGEFSWQGKLYENKTTGFEPIISKKTWKQNQEIIEKRTKNFKGRGLSFLFNHLMACGKCGRAIHGVKFDHATSWKTKKGVTEKKYTYQPRYVCTRGNYYLKGLSIVPKEYVDTEALTIKEDVFFKKDEKTGKSKIRFKEGTVLTAHKCDMPSFNEDELSKMVMKKIGSIKFNQKHWEGIKKTLFKDETKEFLDFEIRELRSEATNNEIKLDKMYEDYQKEIIDADFFKSRSERIRERQAEVKDRLAELEEERENFDNRIGNAIEILDSFKNWEKIFKEATIEKKNHILSLLTIKISTSYENTILGNKEVAYKGLEVEFTPEVRELFRMGILERVDRNRAKHTESKSFNCLKTRYSRSDH